MLWALRAPSQAGGAEVFTGNEREKRAPAEVERDRHLPEESAFPERLHRLDRRAAPPCLHQGPEPGVERPTCVLVGQSRDVEHAEVPRIRPAPREQVFDEIEREPGARSPDGFIGAFHEHVVPARRLDPRAGHSRAPVHPGDVVLDVDPHVLDEVGEVDAGIPVLDGAALAAVPAGECLAHRIAAAAPVPAERGEKSGERPDEIGGCGLRIHAVDDQRELQPSRAGEKRWVERRDPGEFAEFDVPDTDSATGLIGLESLLAVIDWSRRPAELRERARPSGCRRAPASIEKPAAGSGHGATAQAREPYGSSNLLSSLSSVPCRTMRYSPVSGFSASTLAVQLTEEKSNSPS